MKRPHYFAVLVASVVLITGFELTAAAQQAMVVSDDDVGSLTANSTLSRELEEYVGAVRDAGSPSAAVDAYAKGLTALPDRIPLEQAYVQRMAELGVPQMADDQARDLTRRKPSDGLAWAVAAFNDAERGQTVEALHEIGIAVVHLAGDVFVQRTAGQLLAWYDTQADQAQVPDDVRSSVAETRAALSGWSEYEEAYRRAREVYEQDNRAAETAAPSAPSTEPAPAVIYSEPEGAGDTYIAGDTYVVPSYTYADVPYSYGYSMPYYTYSYDPFCGYPAGYFGSWWWSGRPNTICVPRRSYSNHWGAGRFAYFGNRCGPGGHDRYPGPDVLIRPRHGGGSPPAGDRGRDHGGRGPVASSHGADRFGPGPTVGRDAPDGRGAGAGRSEGLPRISRSPSTPRSSFGPSASATRSTPSAIRTRPSTPAQSSSRPLVVPGRSGSRPDLNRPGATSGAPSRGTITPSRAGSRSALSPPSMSSGSSSRATITPSRSGSRPAMNRPGGSSGSSGRSMAAPSHGRSGPSVAPMRSGGGGSGSARGGSAMGGGRGGGGRR